MKFKKINSDLQKVTKIQQQKFVGFSFWNPILNEYLPL